MSSKPETATGAGTTSDTAGNVVGASIASGAPAKDKNVYKASLNLPTTGFAMEAKLVQNEPGRLKKWQERNLYQALQAKWKGNKAWVLHDGPPFANSDIHIGHVSNKTLKDVLMRYKTMAGYATPYVPGWDCHGLPIEHKVQQDLGPKLRQMSVQQVRQLCFDHAMKYVNVQSQQFQRLGILGDWERPYLTMSPQYEAATLEVFAKFVENGLVYKQLKPVAWSTSNQTALADAELEYKDVDDPAVYVDFWCANPGAIKSKFNLRHNATVGLLIWTTTPWTLPANVAIAANADVEYAFVLWEKPGAGESAAPATARISVVAAALVEKVFAKAGIGNFQVVGKATGKELAEAGFEYMHPFMGDGEGPKDWAGPRRLVCADYVTTTDGTGLVHTAPGHGDDDYATGRREKLPVYCPVLPNGRYDTTVPNWIQGQTVWEANKLIMEKLRESGHLFHQEMYRHSYPHDWRSKSPTITRAAEQWFIAVDKAFGGGESIRGRAVKLTASDGGVAGEDCVTFVPDWGKARLGGMLANRPDWCISRQRAWGLPIPVFYNEANEPLLTPGSVRAVARQFAKHGSNAWFDLSPEQLLEGCDTGPAFPKDKLRKENDIFDVWFESGSSWNAVLCDPAGEFGRGLTYPADLYLEGSDQHRGWFQLSLLSSLGAQGKAPFKQVLTHGFIVKPDGTKVSKSDKEYVTATQEIERHGADLLRLWVCSLDYQGDMPASPQAIKEFGDKYRKVRNTIRYLLSNVSDFDPSASHPDIPDESLDGWMMWRLDGLIEEVTAAYEQYQTHKAFRLLHDFCAVDISSVYGNAMKDRLYCEAVDAPIRRRCQVVMYRLADALIRMVAPMVVFTADEAWEHLPKSGAEKDLWNVHLAQWPKVSGKKPSDQTLGDWALLMKLRESATAQLDHLKKSVGLNKSLDAELVYEIPDAGQRGRFAKFGADLEDIAAAGCHVVQAAAGDTTEPRVTAIDRRQTYQACARSWKRRPDVGTDGQFPELSARDAGVMKRT